MAWLTSEEKRVVERFKEELRLILEFIQDSLAKGNAAEANQWLAELGTIEQKWGATRLAYSKITYRGNITEAQIVLDPTRPKKLAEARERIARVAFKKGDSMMAKAGYKYKFT